MLSIRIIEWPIEKASKYHLTGILSGFVLGVAILVAVGYLYFHQNPSEHDMVLYMILVKLSYLPRHIWIVSSLTFLGIFLVKLQYVLILDSVIFSKAKQSRWLPLSRVCLLCGIFALSFRASAGPVYGAPWWNFSGPIPRIVSSIESAASVGMALYLAHTLWIFGIRDWKEALRKMILFDLALVVFVSVTLYFSAGALNLTAIEMISLLISGVATYIVMSQAVVAFIASFQEDGTRAVGQPLFRSEMISNLCRTYRRSHGVSIASGILLSIGFIFGNLRDLIRYYAKHMSTEAASKIIEGLLALLYLYGHYLALLLAGIALIGVFLQVRYRPGESDYTLPESE